jgi:hypothetical protein
MPDGQMWFGRNNNAGAAAPTQTVLRSQNNAQATLVVRNDRPRRRPAPPPGNGLEVIGGPVGVKATGGHESDEDGIGVHGLTELMLGIGVLGEGTTSAGVRGTSGSGNGVEGESTNGNGVRGGSSSRIYSGVYGENLSGSGFGIHARSNTPGNIPGVFGAALLAENTINGGYAGIFDGKVRVTGHLDKSGGGFGIDHPVDPANRCLYHSFVESPDMMNVYNGNVSTDAEGNATVELPGYFEALNRDFRYQLTPIGEFAQAIVAEEVKDNRFKIKTDKPNVRVSRQITGIRQDAWANAHPMEVEVEKPEGQRGKYLTPEEHGQPKTASIYQQEFPSSEEAEADRDQRQGE